MKSGIIGGFIAIMIITVFIIMSSLAINANVKNDLNESLNTAINTTEHTLYDGRKDIQSNDEYLNEFKSNFSKQISEKDITYKVNVFGLDYKKGLIDIGITATYKNLYGLNKTITARRTMIINKKG